MKKNSRRLRRIVCFLQGGASLKAEMIGWYWLRDHKRGDEKTFGEKSCQTKYLLHPYSTIGEDFAAD